MLTPPPSQMIPHQRSNNWVYYSNNLNTSTATLYCIWTHTVQPRVQSGQWVPGVKYTLNTHSTQISPIISQVPLPLVPVTWGHWRFCPMAAWFLMVFYPIPWYLHDMHWWSTGLVQGGQINSVTNIGWPFATYRVIPNICLTCSTIFCLLWFHCILLCM